MPRPQVLTIELSRADNPNRSEVFDGTAKQYTARGSHGRLGTAIFPWKEVEALRPDLERRTPSPNAQRQVGNLLRRFLEDVLKELGGWRRIEEALLTAEARQQPIQLLFRFGAAELFDLPWALLEFSDNQRTLGSIRPHPLAFDLTHDRPARVISSRPCRVLFAWSDADGGVLEDKHREALSEAWPGFDPARDELQDVTLESLDEKLAQARREGKPFHVLHILCHGGLIPGGTFGLFWSKPHRVGVVDPIAGGPLRNLLARYQQELQVIVLSACQTSSPGPVGEMHGGVAHDLHRTGVPAVIASQRALSVAGSLRMTKAFYEALSRPDASVREAFQEAHAALDPSSFDWASLQLLTNTPVASPREPVRVRFTKESALPEMPDGEVVVAYEVNFDVATMAILDAMKVSMADALVIVELSPLDRLKSGLPSTQAEWKKAIKRADQLVDALGPRVSRVRLFGCAPLPLMFHIGWRLARRKLRVYQEPWPRTGDWNCGFDSEQSMTRQQPFLRTESWPGEEARKTARGRLVVTVEVTHAITPEVLKNWLGDESSPPMVRLVAEGGPSPKSVEGPQDTARAVEDFHACLNRIHRELPGIQEIWLALVCPGSFAAALGRAYNPNPHPRLVLFNFRRTQDGERYEEVPWNGGVE